MSAIGEYRIRVLDPDHELMRVPLSYRNSVLWNSIDNRQVLFNDPEKLKDKLANPERSDYKIVEFSPRARYVYWTYT